MKVTLLLLISLISLLSPPTFSHGSKENCSMECNDYYCPPGMKKEKENKFSGKK